MCWESLAEDIPKGKVVMVFDNCYVSLFRTSRMTLAALSNFQYHLLSLPGHRCSIQIPRNGIHTLSRNGVQLQGWGAICHDETCCVEIKSHMDICQHQLDPGVVIPSLPARQKFKFSISVRKVGKRSRGGGGFSGSK
jgi:hypothetical protein